MRTDLSRASELYCLVKRRPETRDSERLRAESVHTYVKYLCIFLDRYLQACCTLETFRYTYPYHCETTAPPVEGKNKITLINIDVVQTGTNLIRILLRLLDL